MELITILNRCHRFPGFVYQHAHLGATQLYGAPSGKKVDSSNLAIFLIEQGTQRLWISRQNGTQEPGVPTFGPWVPLGNQLEAIVCAEYVAGNPEVFTVDLDMNIYRMTQDANDTIWTTRKVAAPTPPQGTPGNIASTMMNIQTVDSSGTPVAGAMLTVSVTTPTTLIANQLSYLAEPSAPAVIPLDATGSAAVYYQATTLASNRLCLSVANSDGSSAERWCEGDMVELKTNETPPPARTDSVAQKLAGASQSDLQNSGLLDPNYSDPDAAVQSINSLGNWMITQGSQPGGVSSKIKPQAWRLELGKDSGPVFHTLTTDEAESYLAGKALLGGIFGNVWGDIVHGIKHYWDKVTSVVAKVTADGIEFAVNLGNQVAHFVVNTARQAAAAAEMIFTVIKKAALAVYEAIQDVIAWLKLLFEWQDILNTHNVLRSCFNQFLSMIAGSIGNFEGLFRSKFSTFSAQISQAFDNAANNDIFQNSFDQYVQSIQSQTKTPSGLDGGMYNTPYQQHSTRIHYVYHHAKNHYASNSSLKLCRLGDISALTASIQNNWNADGGFQQRAQTVHNQITGNGISKFFDLVMKDFLLAIKDIVMFVLQGAEDILSTTLGLVKDAVTSLQTSLNASIDIPVISYIYKLVSGGDNLSILDLLCLILAVPVTILYKVIFGSAPFSADSVNQLNNLPWPSLSSAARSSGGKSLAAVSLSALSPLFITLGEVAGLCDYFGSFIGTVCDALAFVDTSGYDPLKLFLSWSSVAIAGLTQVSGAPWSVFAKTSWSTADDWNVALWAISIVPFASDTIFTLATGALARFTDTLGPILDSGLGLGMSGLGAATCIQLSESKGPDSYNGWDCANSIVPWPSRFFKWCILGKDEPEAAPVLAAVLLGADILFGVGSTVTQIGSAAAG